MTKAGVIYLLLYAVVACIHMWVIMTGNLRHETHMLQLNSYFNKRYINYLKKNKGKIIDYKALIALVGYVFTPFGAFPAIAAYALVYILIDMAKPKKAEILLNSLVVNELKMNDYPEYSDKKKKIGEIFLTLQKEGYIYNLRNVDNQVFSFVYSTRQAKQLMTNAGRILEIYVYHKLQESGFDDVVSGYEINWGDTDVKTEFDVLVTSGFKCAMIECKATDKISQDYYYKLSCLAKQFGINAIPILIADTHEREDWDNSVNEMQRERGNMMGVVTVYERDDISNIDVTLRRILNGKY